MLILIMMMSAVETTPSPLLISIPSRPIQIRWGHKRRRGPARFLCILRVPWPGFLLPQLWQLPVLAPSPGHATNCTAPLSAAAAVTHSRPSACHVYHPAAPAIPAAANANRSSGDARPPAEHRQPCHSQLALLQQQRRPRRTALLQRGS